MTVVISSFPKIFLDLFLNFIGIYTPVFFLIEKLKPTISFCMAFRPSVSISKESMVLGLTDLTKLVKSSKD